VKKTYSLVQISVVPALLCFVLGFCYGQHTDYAQQKLRAEAALPSQLPLPDSEIDEQVLFSPTTSCHSVMRRTPTYIRLEE